MARELKPRSLGVGVARCRPLPRALQAMTCNRHDVRLWIFVRRCRSGRTDLGLQNSSFLDRETDSQSVGFSLNGTPCALQHYMSLIPKTKEVLRVGLGF